MKTIHFFQVLKTKTVLRTGHTVIVLLAATFLGSSCSNFLEVDLPSSQLTGNAVFEEATTANAAMAGVYAKLRDTGILTGQPGGLSCRLGLYADELDNYRTGETNYFFSNALYSAEPGIKDLWNQSYNIIYSVNAIAEGVERSDTLPQELKEQLKGEVLFIRALIHFYLVNMYGGIPYVTTTDYQANAKIHKLTVQEVYSLVTQDLDEAVALLPEGYISAERVRPNKAAAYALLARVHLYNGGWAEASDSASAVINNELYLWETDLDRIFLKESTTTIWQLMPGSDGANTYEGDLFIFNAGPPPFVALTQSLLNSFEEGDQRKVHWVREITDGTTSWSHAYKYKQDAGAGSSTEYSIIFRLAELYLIRAEARAQQGELIGAKEDLNMVRTTAGLPATQAGSAAEIVDAVLKERRVEFFTELGHRFLDLKRIERLDFELSASKPGWSHDDRLFPLPAQELSANPNLNPQNPGY